MINNKVIERFLISICCSLVFLLLPLSVTAQGNKTVEFKTWVAEMKESPKGPFYLIRWYCKDGRVMPAKPYPCGERGGYQHGQLNNKAKKLRAAGYQIANVFAGIKAANFYQSRDWRDKLGQVVTERFLIDFDDGWIYRGARFYRGALQVEDEVEGAKDLSNALFDKIYRNSRATDQDFLLLREVFRVLPRLKKTSSVVSVRNITSMIDARDSRFKDIRVKVHNLPDVSDAQRVREHAIEHGLPALKKDYEKLARAIEKVYQSSNTGEAITRFAKTLGKGDLKTTLNKAAKVFTPKESDEVRLAEAGNMLRVLRESYPRFRTNYTRRGMLQLSLQLEQEVFATANRLAKKAKQASRAQNILWLKSLGSALYGVGLISQREWLSFEESIANLSQQELSLEQYRHELRYLNRVPGWANHWLKFHFGDAVQQLSRVEPLAVHLFPDRLRASPLLAYGLILDELSKDANKLASVHHQLFGITIGSGLRSLNPGMARGVLRLPLQGKVVTDKNSIVLLPETTAELSPVAGILTMGEGNALSHVQLLAGNLGIPNVVVAEKLRPLLEPYSEDMVVMAVSPGGVVQLEVDSTAWHEYFSRQITPEEGAIKPDLEKLDLDYRNFISLADLRARHAGRITGPKAANLGELKYHFPQAVTSGLVVPFGEFRALLEQPYPESELTVFDWMQSEYQRIRQLPPKQREAATTQLQHELRKLILSASPGTEFRKRLKKRLRETFGKEGSYAVFVRSDTNVEDLPGFTGAGLNLTVPNVKGFNNILKAILRVWASPFEERAFAWRQQRMANPEHVYPSVLLMKSVSVDKSGVMLSLDTETGKRNALTIAVNHGIGGAVQGQSAEELLIDSGLRKVRLLADATAAKQRVLSRKGGLIKKQLSADGRVLTDNEIAQLIELAAQLADKFPQRDDRGEITAADVEFGFDKGELVLFQVRPYLQNRRVKKNHYLNTLDQSIGQGNSVMVNMNEEPES